MQEQYVRKACVTVASQLILVTTGDDSKHANTYAGNHNSNTVAAVRVTNAHPSSASTEANAVTGADDLQRSCDEVVRHAMTLYRLCRRPGGGAIDIVPVSTSSGAGSASVVEEAAYCVCAAIMALEPHLWASLVRRAQLLRPRKPRFLFVAPVAVPPVVVKDVEKFFGRSRHLMSSRAAHAALTSGAPTMAAASTDAAAPSLACEGGGATAPPASASASPFATTSATFGLSARRAEAVAACFFFKTMSAAERLRRRDIFEVRAQPPNASRAVEASANACTLTATATSPDTAVGAPAEDEGRGVVVAPSLRKLTGATTTATSATAQERTACPGKSRRPSGLRAMAGNATAPSDTGRFLHSRSTRSAASLLPSHLFAASMLFNDGLGGWNNPQVTGSTHADHLPLSSTRRPGCIDSAENDAGVGDWPHGISSESSSQSRGSSPGNGGIGTIKGQMRLPSAGKDRSTHDQKAADTAAVLTRLYALALSSENASADELPNAAASTPQQQHDGSGSRYQVGGSAALPKDTHTLFSAAVPPAPLSTGSGSSLVALGASVSYACDALHWGRLQMLVRYPLLFRATPAPLEVITTVALAGGGEALTEEAMSHMSGIFGMASTEAVLSTSATLPDSTAGSCDRMPPALAFLASMSSLYGPSGFILNPARLHTSSPPLLFPSPPSLVTDGFLFTRLLICSAWLLVYADSLVGNDDKVASVEQTPPATDSRGLGGEVWPRVCPTPAVQAIVAYCVAIVREAREMSAGVTAAARSGHGSLSGTVCCPVCDDLVREKQLALWWSTLRDDRASLRAQVRSVLENNSANDDEAEIAAALVDRLTCEGRGRRYATPLLSGSEGTPCRITALQQRWGAYIMQADTSVTDYHAAVADACDVADEGEEEAMSSAEVLWAALTQRIAAVTDFCVFLSSNPIEAAASHSPAGASMTSGRPKRPRSERDKGAASRAVHRPPRPQRHRDTYAVDSDESSDGGWEDEDGTRAHNASRTGVALQGSRHAVEEAEGWGRLLCRCGWVNAAPPAGGTSPCLYKEWASSLFLPSAMPTPQQADTLRRRLSRYTLEDMVRKLVLGRGGSWDRYARLLFGDAVRTDSTGSLFCPPPAMEVGATSTNGAPAQPMAEPAAPCHSPRPREPSLSLLEEVVPDAEGVYVPHRHVVPRATQISPPQRGRGAAAQGTPHRPSGLAQAPQWSCDTASASVDPVVTYAVTEERRATTPVGKAALSYIPLHVSPLTHQQQLRAPLGAAAAAPPPPPPPSPLPSAADAAAHATTAAPKGDSDADEAPVQQKDGSARASASVSLDQLRAQQAALYTLLRFRPRLPPLREEDAVLECASCFSLFHQECIAPVQRNFMGQAFLCHTCRLRWARPQVAGPGLVHQAPEQHHHPEVARGRGAADRR